MYDLCIFGMFSNHPGYDSAVYELLNMSVFQLIFYPSCKNLYEFLCPTVTAYYLPNSAAKFLKIFIYIFYTTVNLYIFMIMPAKNGVLIPPTCIT